MARFTWRSSEELAARRRAEAMDALRARRDQLLRESDWTQMPDAPLTPEERAEWAAYRQALRDLPQQAERLTDLGALPMPEPPQRRRNAA